MRVWLFVIIMVSTFAGASWGRRVLVVPFEPISATDRSADLGPGIAEAIGVELAGIKGLVPVEPAAPMENHLGIEAAREQARQVSADLVVFGSYQLSDAEIRIIGYVVNVADGKIIGSLKSTGPRASLFALQDSVVAQVRRAVLLPHDRPPGIVAIRSGPMLAPTIEYSGPVRAPIETYTPRQWRSPQQMQLVIVAETSYRRWPGYGCWRWCGWHRAWSCWPNYGTYFWPTYVR